MVELLAFLATTPDLRGAACRNYVDVFDAAADRRIAGAVSLAQTVCAKCPVLAECRHWARSAPQVRAVVGVIAGQYRTRPRARRP